MLTTFIVAALSIAIAFGAAHPRHTIGGGSPAVPVSTADGGGDTITGGGPPGK